MLEALSCVRRQVGERCHAALPVTTVEAPRPALSEERHKGRHELEGGLVQGLGQRQGVLQGCITRRRLRHFVRTRASRLHIEELHATLALGVPRQSLGCRAVLGDTVHRVVTLLIDVALAAEARARPEAGTAVWPETSAAVRPEASAAVRPETAVRGTGLGSQAGVESARSAQVLGEARGEAAAGAELGSSAWARACARSRCARG
mmetsp:Transcript_12815/g.26961  ORF Transcript_12815/g.26961 Transcript_12815/m.26961 type:complete len:205 (-) Transcript_12815:365-979(-)